AHAPAIVAPPRPQRPPETEVAPAAPSGTWLPGMSSTASRRPGSGPPSGTWAGTSPAASFNIALQPGDRVAGGVDGVASFEFTIGAKPESAS
ncbi:hypothetical protein PPH41_39195, partial [Burkholderia gladioli]|nr:hypothetical protein [Burkholderia gladioli]